MEERKRMPDRRREWTRAEILNAAWEIARRDGIAALSLREIAAKVGMRAPSLYTYFPSKNALYDAMYAQGMREFAEQLGNSPPGRDPQQRFRNRVKAWANAAVEDPFRFELLFQRPIPGFTPSAESLAIGLTSLEETRRIAAAAGLRSRRSLDMLLGVTRGLAGTQNANEPGGRRWVGLIDEALDILIAHYARSD